MSALRRLTFLLETAVVLGGLVGLNFWLAADTPGFVTVRPHPFYAVVLLITVRYGFAPGLISAALASGSYFAQLVLGLDVPTWRDFLAVDYSRPIVIMFAGAGVIGLIVSGHLRQIARLRERLGEAAADKASLETEQAELRDVNTELATRIVGADATLPALYRYAQLLNQTDLDDIYRGLIAVLHDAMHADEAAVYGLDDRGGWTRIHGEGPDELPLTGALRARLVGDGGIVTLRDLPDPGPDGPPLYLAGALRSGGTGEVKAVLTVNRIPFLRYGGPTIRLFGVLVDWAAASIENALQFAAMPSESQHLRQQRAEASSRRVVTQFMRTNMLRLDDLVALDAADDIAGDLVNAGVPITDDATAPVLREATGPRRGFGAPRASTGAALLQPPSARGPMASPVPDEPYLADFGSESEPTMVVDAIEPQSDHGIQAAIAAEIGRNTSSFGRQKFATMLSHLGDFLEQQSHKED